MTSIASLSQTLKTLFGERAELHAHKVGLIQRRRRFSSLFLAGFSTLMLGSVISPVLPISSAFMSANLIAPLCVAEQKGSLTQANAHMVWPSSLNALSHDIPPRPTLETCYPIREGSNGLPFSPSH